jgi:hypothetical protein
VSAQDFANATMEALLSSRLSQKGYLGMEGNVFQTSLRGLPKGLNLAMPIKKE